jgi:hypothetical protein
MDNTDTYYLVADINTNVTGVTVSATLVAASSKIKATNGTLATIN